MTFVELEQLHLLYEIGKFRRQGVDEKGVQGNSLNDICRVGTITSVV